MSAVSKRIVLGLGAAAIAVALAGATITTSQTVSAAQGPGGGRGGPGRFGGPGGPGGPFGRGGPGGPGGPLGVLGPMVLQRLDLTTDQRDRVKQIVDSHREEQRALGDRGMAAHEALDAAITSDALNEGLLRAVAADLAAVEADETVLHARIYSEVLQILTTDQQAKLKTIQAEMRQRQEQMRANRDQQQKH